MRAYHFVSTDHALSNIRERRLKIATFDDMNDPIELRAVNVKTRDSRKGWEGFRDEIARRYGVVCFSRTWHDPVLWSHYAERHKGVCLGFDIAEEGAVEVQYRPSRFPHRRLVEAVSSDVKGETFVVDVIRTKYDRWSYEQEVRVLCPLEQPDQTGLYFAPFDPRVKLAEVIIGVASDCTRSAVRATLGDLSSQVAVKNTRLAFNGYRIVTQNDPKLWR